MKKNEIKNEIKNYRPVSILNWFSKIYEKFLNKQLLPFVNRFLSKLVSAHRSGYSTNYILIRLIEIWRHTLDNNLFAGAVLMDLSKAFNCIPHDLLIAKLHAYGPDFDRVTTKLPANIKSLTSITKFKEYIRTLFGPRCKCNVCRMVM